MSLAELQPQLKEMSEKATKMTQQIEQETITVEKASALVKEDEKIANKQAAAAQNLKRECEADLAEAIPILDEVKQRNIYTYIQFHKNFIGHSGFGHFKTSGYYTGQVHEEPT